MLNFIKSASLPCGEGAVFISLRPSIRAKNLLPQTERYTSHVERLRAMQNIHEILSGIGIEVPENKKADFEKALRENYKTVAEVGKIEAARDGYKEQLGSA